MGSQIDNMQFDYQEENQMIIDLIGLTFYGVSDEYRRKFITIHAHLQFEHHPIRKLLDVFRKWLEDFLKEK